jgi:hypothetical protein
MVIIIILKLNLMIDSRQSSGHWSRSGSRIELTRVNVRIKVIIIIVLKPDLKVSSRQGPGHELS